MRLQPAWQEDATQQTILHSDRACATWRACHLTNHVWPVPCQCPEQTANCASSTIPLPAGSLQSPMQLPPRQSLQSANPIACRLLHRFRKSKPQPPAKESSENKLGTCSTPDL